MDMRFKAFTGVFTLGVLLVLFQNCGRTDLVSPAIPEAEDYPSKESLIQECVPRTMGKLAFTKAAPKAGPDSINAIRDGSSSLVLVVDNTCSESNILSEARELIYSLNEFDRVSGRSAFKLDTKKITNAQRFIESLESDPCIISVDKDATFSLTSSESPDPYLPLQKHLTAIKHQNIYKSLFNIYNGINANIRVAVLDSGVDMLHPDLINSLVIDSQGKVFGLNGITMQNDFSDTGFHGTHVAGIIGATSNNGTGISGVMGKNIRLLPVKVSNDGNSVDLQAVLNGIYWAADQGADVMNLSLGGPTDRSGFREAIQYAIDKGAFIAVAAGNNGFSLDSNAYFPAKYSKDFKGMVTVGSTDALTGARSSFSNYSPIYVDIMAPGSQGSEGIVSTVPQNISSGYANKVSGNPIHGTSMATPVISGAAAITYGLAKSRGFRPLPEQVEHILKKAARRSSSLTSFSENGNFLDLEALVLEVDRDMGLDVNSTKNRNQGAGKIVIAKQPQDTSVLLGNPVELSVETSTTQSSIFLNYQWYRNGRIMVGETKPTLKIKKTTEGHAANYFVNIRSGTTDLNSSSAVITLGKGYCN